MISSSPTFFSAGIWDLGVAPFVSVLWGVANWALIGHIVLAQAEKEKQKEEAASETPSFLQESGFGGFKV